MYGNLSLDAARFRDEEIRRRSNRPERLFELEFQRERRVRRRRRGSR
jgi:hypothetical protein